MSVGRTLLYGVGLGFRYYTAFGPLQIFVPRLMDDCGLRVDGGNIGRAFVVDGEKVCSHLSCWPSRALDPSHIRRGIAPINFR